MSAPRSSTDVLLNGFLGYPMMALVAPKPPPPQPVADLIALVSGRGSPDACERHLDDLPTALDCIRLLFDDRVVRAFADHPPSAITSGHSAWSDLCINYISAPDHEQVQLILDCALESPDFSIAFLTAVGHYLESEVSPVLQRYLLRLLISTGFLENPFVREDNVRHLLAYIHPDLPGFRYACVVGASLANDEQSFLEAWSLATWSVRPSPPAVPRWRGRAIDMAASAEGRARALGIPQPLPLNEDAVAQVRSVLGKTTDCPGEESLLPAREFLVVWNGVLPIPRGAVIRRVLVRELDGSHAVRPIKFAPGGRRGPPPSRASIRNREWVRLLANGALGYRFHDYLISRPSDIAVPLTSLLPSVEGFDPLDEGEPPGALSTDTLRALGNELLENLEKLTSHIRAESGLPKPNFADYGRSGEKLSFFLNACRVQIISSADADKMLRHRG